VPRITFVQPDATEQTIEAATGQSVMRVAIAHGISGIVAECGGGLSCATCHVYVPDDWSGKLPPPSEEEIEMLEMAVDTRPTSRLSCQIPLNDHCDGLVILLPERQL
jgi:2Fe-2S ferredoxin